MHVYFAENEEGHINSGTLSAVIDGRWLTAGPGESTSISRGLAHRWRKEGDDLLEFEGYARPEADLDRYLQAVFEVMNAGPAGLRSFTWPMWPCAIAASRPFRSCRGRFRLCCFGCR